MKGAVPDSTKIAKDAKECMQECVSEFICFITSEAADNCRQEKRKTIAGEDVLTAMVRLGFEQYAEPLKIHLIKLREVSPWLYGAFSNTEALYSIKQKRARMHLLLRKLILSLSCLLWSSFIQRPSTIGCLCSKYSPKV